MSLVAWVGFVVAGAAGAVARVLVDGAVRSRAPGRFPWGTLAVNASGSLVLGVITGLALFHGVGGASTVVLGVGFCGAYTTFSTFAFETVRLAGDGAVVEALGNALGTFAVCAAAAAIGIGVAGVG